MIIMAIIIIMVLVIIKIIMVITIIMTAIKACKKVRGFSGQVCPDDKQSTSGRIFIPITKPAGQPVCNNTSAYNTKPAHTKLFRRIQ